MRLIIACQTLGISNGKQECVLCRVPSQGQRAQSLQFRQLGSISMLESLLCNEGTEIKSILRAQQRLG